MWGWCIVTLASARLKASVRFPPLRGMYQRGGTCKGCDSSAMHFIMSLLKSQGHDTIFVMVDLGSKLAHKVLTWGSEFQLETTRPFLNVW